MKTYVVTHGNHDDTEVTLVTDDFDLAIKHLLDYSKIAWWHVMDRIQIWENNSMIFCYGDSNDDVINNKKEEISYDIIKNDMMMKMNKENIN